MEPIQENSEWLDANISLWKKGKLNPEEFLKPSSWVFCKTGKKQELNLYNSSSNYHLHSPYNIDVEARQWKGLHDFAQIECLVVYGIGLGYYYLSIVGWLRENPRRRILFIEDDPGVIRAFLSTDVSKDFLTDSQAQLIYFSQSEYERSIRDSLFRKLKISALASYEVYKREQYENLSHAIHYVRNIQQGSLAEYLLGGNAFFSNYYRNMYQLDSAYDGTAFFNRFNAIPAIICGAGPSLNKNIELLKKLKDRAIIFAGGTAMNALNACGMVPHFGCGLDPFATQFNRIVSNTAFDTPFFFTSRMNANALEMVHGPHLYLPGSKGYPITNWMDNQLGYSPSDLDEGANVINMSLSIAQKMGCKVILLVGLDLAYTDGLSYAPGIKTHSAFDPKTKLMSKGAEEELVLARDIYGKPTYSLMKWIAESSWYASFAKNHPEIQLLNCTEGGIGFKDIPHLTLDEAAQTYLTQSWDLNGLIAAGFSEKTAPTLECIHNVLEKLKESLLACRDDLIEFHKKAPEAWLEKIPVSSALLIELEEKLNSSIAYNHLLKPFDQAYLNYVSSDLAASQQSEIQASMATRFSFMLKIVMDNLFHMELAHLQKLDLEKNLNLKQKPIFLSQEVVEMPKNKKGELRQFFDNQNQFIGESSYLGDNLHGPSLFFNPSNQKMVSSSCYIEGHKQDAAYTWYKQGELWSKQFFEKGHEEGAQYTFYNGENLKSVLNFTKGQLDGPVILYYPNGAVKRSAHFKNGRREGSDSIYKANGSPLMQAEYKDDLPIGIAKVWHANGNLAKEISYPSAGIVGVIHHFDEAGKLIPVQSASYFDTVTKDSLHLKEVIAGMTGILDTLLHSTENQRSVDAQNELRDEFVILQEEMKNFQQKGNKLLQETGLVKGEEHEVIWQTPETEKALDNMLQEMVTPMQETMMKLEWELKQMVQKLQEKQKKSNDT